MINVRHGQASLGKKSSIRTLDLPPSSGGKCNRENRLQCAYETNLSTWNEMRAYSSGTNRAGSHLYPFNCRRRQIGPSKFCGF